MGARGPRGSLLLPPGGSEQAEFTEFVSEGPETDAARRIRSIIIDLECRTSRHGGNAVPRSAAARSSQGLLLQQVGFLLAFEFEHHVIAGDRDDFGFLHPVTDVIGLAA